MFKLLYKPFLKFFKSRNDRKLKLYYSRVKRINELEEKMVKLTNEEITLKREEFIQRLTKGESLNDLLPESFALVREASKRSLGMRHFDVQLIGGMVLHEGMIAEMKTGEGKTLVASLAIYLNSLKNKVHLVTANDYLAKRDSETLSLLYSLLGVSVGVITSSTPIPNRKKEYKQDVVYTTNNELGFDYLRDNMRMEKDEMSLINHELSFAIVDEIDSILIDEARTPLIISGIAEGGDEFYNEASFIVKTLSDSSFEIDETQRSVYLTEQGYSEIEEALRKIGILEKDEVLFGDSSYLDQILKPEIYFRNGKIVNFINNALRAEKLFKQDIDYIIKGEGKNSRVLIIDEFTGRISEGRRYSNGLHQALEAKHNAPIQPESQTIASITYQNYFRMYKKLAGMTGTAQTEAEEFREIYKLDVVSIPTNKKISRIDENDLIYRTKREKFSAIANFVEELHTKGQPVLIGTVSIEKSEQLSEIFKQKKLPHNVLNAKFHEKEAEIIADAGKKGAITIATNMAGRGTDIVLGGNLEKKLLKTTNPEKERQIKDEYFKEAEEVKKAGGLYIIGSERHESRRVDNQLRGRSGRQGDIGYSKFFLSLEDDLLRIFGGKTLDSVLSKLGFKEGESIDHPWLNSVIERAQKKVEARNFEIRKNLIKYDNLLNEQRHIIYTKRLALVYGGNEEMTNEMSNIIEEEVDVIFEAFLKAKEAEEINIVDITRKMFNIQESIILEGDINELKEKVLIAVNQIYHEKTLMKDFESRQKFILLQSLDYSWKEHLYGIDMIHSKISLRSYAQKDPLNEYKLEIFKAFEECLAGYRKLVIINTFKN
jgi:preprotein translocase subunit SecA